MPSIVYLAIRLRKAFLMGEEEAQLTTPNIFQVDRVTPILFKPIDKSAYFVDFGKAAFANMEITYEAKRAHTLTIRIGEQLTEGAINTDPQGHIRYQEIATTSDAG